MTVRLLALAMIAVMSMGCDRPDEPSSAGREIPAGAVPAGEDLYMVPAGADPDGCPWYRPFSLNRGVAQAMYYRVDGRFVMGKPDPATCRRG